MYRRSTRQRAALIALLALSATIVTLDFRQSGGPLKRIQNLAVSIVAPLQDGIAHVFKPVGNFLSSIGQIGGLRNENARLREQTDKLESQLRGFPELQRENQRLLDLLGEKAWTQGPRVGSRVIGVGPSNYEWTAFLDKGLAEGIKEGMAVVSDEGLVGRIVLAGQGYSKVVLIIDPAHSVGSRLTASGETGALSGRGEDDLRFDFIDAETDVKIGETVVTSGYDKGIYPAGIPIGRVTSVKATSNGLEKTAYVRPFVDFSKMDHVLVLTSTGPIPGK